MLKKERPSNYKPYTTTLEIQRKNYCSRVITNAIRRYISIKKYQRQLNPAYTKATFDDMDDDHN